MIVVVPAAIGRVLRLLTIVIEVSVSVRVRLLHDVTVKVEVVLVVVVVARACLVIVTIAVMVLVNAHAVGLSCRSKTPLGELIVIEVPTVNSGAGLLGATRAEVEERNVANKTVRKERTNIAVQN